MTPHMGLWEAIEHALPPDDGRLEGMTPAELRTIVRDYRPLAPTRFQVNDALKALIARGRVKRIHRVGVSHYLRGPNCTIGAED